MVAAQSIGLYMKPEPFQAKTKVWRIPNLSDLELLRATHQTQSFPKHTHERYALGVIERGALGFYYRGENVVASAGDISLCIPGEAHTGQPAACEGWTYRMFYFDTSFFVNLASELADRPRDLPFFQSGTIVDDTLARQLRALHIRLEDVTVPKLEQETALLHVLAQLIGRHADVPIVEPRVGQETRVVTQVKRYLEHHYTETVSLAHLAELTGLSQYYLVRVFHQSVGVPPQAYLRQVRIRHAKDLLTKGYTVAEVALETGFTDQSHLTRWFKRLWGFTPGQYRASAAQERTRRRDLEKHTLL